jgi:hypothetical protein
MRKSLIAILAMSLSAAAQAAQPGMRDCTVPDVTGTWSLVKIDSAQAGVQDFYRANPNEVMRFGVDGSFIYVARAAPYSASEARHSLDKADAVDGVTYNFQITGDRLILFREGSPFEGFVCAIATADSGQAKRGDMILANLPNRAGLKRIQRKLR